MPYVFNPFTGNLDKNDGNPGPQGPAGPVSVAFKNIVVGADTIVADAAEDTLTLTAGTNITLNADTTTDTITINASGGGGGSGTVTSVGTGTGLSGGPITTTGTIALANTAVTAGSYTYSSITVDQQGRLTAASSGTAPVTSVGVSSPISSTGGTTPTISISAATTSAAGSMSAADKTKLDGIAAGAQVNVDTNLTYTASTRLLESSTGTDVTLPLFDSTNAGLVAGSGGGTTNFLRADGTWAAPSGGGSGGGTEPSHPFLLMGA